MHGALALQRQKKQPEAAAQVFKTGAGRSLFQSHYLQPAVGSSSPKSHGGPRVEERVAQLPFHAPARYTLLYLSIYLSMSSSTESSSVMRDMTALASLCVPCSTLLFVSVYIYPLYNLITTSDGGAGTLNIASRSHVLSCRNLLLFCETDELIQELPFALETRKKKVLL